LLTHYQSVETTKLAKDTKDLQENLRALRVLRGDRSWTRFLVEIEQDTDQTLK